MPSPFLPSPPTLRHALPTLADALNYLADVDPLGSEEVPLADAGGRTLATPIRARIDLPRRDAAAMDGYALGSDVATGSSIRWRIVEPQAAATNPIAQDEALRVATGAPLPDGAVCVIPI